MYICLCMYIEDHLTKVRKEEAIEEQETQRARNTQNQGGENFSYHIIVKTLSILNYNNKSNNKKTSKATKEKSQVTCKGNSFRMLADFSMKMSVHRDCSFVPSHPDLKNHTGTVLITALLSQ